MSPANQIRLPLEGATLEPIPHVSDALRAPIGKVSIALAGTSNAVLTQALDVVREACGQQGVKAQELYVVLRKTNGVDVALPVIRGSLLALPSALVDVESTLAGVDLVLATGLAFIAIRRPTLSVLITGGLASVEWKSEVRDLRHRFDLIIPELDAFLAGELVKRLVAGAASPTSI